MTTIHKPNLGYDILKLYCDWCVRRSYRIAEVRGIENLPEDGAVILASNHCNTLMDALVILRAHPKMTVFGARADIFKNPIAAKIVTFLRILPMVRERDGIRNVVKNFDTMDQISEILDDGVAFCFFPEGTHRPKHSLLPIKKGLTRMAMVADAKIDPSKPLYMVPVGLEYGDYFRFRSTSLVTFGKPVEIREKIRSTENKDLKFYNECSAIYSESISRLFAYIPDDENYDGVWALTRIMCDVPVLSMPSRHSDDMKEMIRTIQNLMSEKPSEAAALLDEARQLDEDRKKAGISMLSLRKGSLGGRVALKSILMPLYTLFAAVSAVLAAPTLCLAAFLVKNAKDRAFRNTMRTVSYILTAPLMAIIWGVVGLVASGWVIAALLFILSFSAMMMSYDFVEFARVYVSDIKLLFQKSILKKVYKIKSDFARLVK